jgi:hypothetical protein
MNEKHDPSKMIEMVNITHAQTRTSISSGVNLGLTGLYPTVVISFPFLELQVDQDKWQWHYKLVACILTFPNSEGLGRGNENDPRNQ